MAIGRPIEQTPNIADKVVTATATAGQTQFTVTGGYRINHLAVFRNGVRLVNGNDYTALDGTTITLMEDASNLDVLEFQVFDTFSVSDALLTNAASQTVNGDVTVNGTFTVGSGGIGTFAAATVKVGIVSSSTGITTVQSLQASSSTTTGALVVKGGVGIGKSLYVGGNLSVGGTITYEDITNVDSVGLVTAGKGLRATSGGLIVTAGVSTFAGLTTVTNTAALHSKQLNVSAGSTFGGAVTANSTLTVANNLSVAQNIVHTGDTDTKIEFLTDTLCFDTGGSERLRINSSGYLGIGTANPTAPLNVRNSTSTLGILTSTSDGANFDLYDNDTQSRIRTIDGELQFRADVGNAVADSSIRFFVDGANEKVRIASTGKVGIGSDNPSGTLSLLAQNPNIRFDDSDTANNGEITLDNTQLRIEVDEDNAVGSSQIKFRIDGSDKLLLDSNGYLGINATPSCRLDVRDSSTTVYPFHSAQSGTYAYTPYTHEAQIRNNQQGTHNGFTGLFFHCGEDTGGGKNSVARISAIDSGDYRADITFGTRNTSFQERMRIKFTGSVGIGTTVPNNKLHVVSSDYQTIRCESNSAGADGTYLELYANSASPADNDYLGLISFKGNDDAGNETAYAQIRSRADDVSNSTETGHISFHTRNSGTFAERFKINANGNVTVTDGDLVIGTAGHGIDFGVTGLGTGTSQNELFDDYEEGSWTPVYQNGAGSITIGGYASQVGRYVRVGRMVYISGVLKTTSVSNISAGTYDIGGLPFSGATGGAIGYIACFLQSSWTNAPHSFDLVAGTASVRARGGLDVGDGGYTTASTTDFHTGAGDRNRTYFAGWYRTLA